MQIIEIKNIIKKDIPLHYRNEFSGSLVYNTVQKKNLEKRIEFSLEKNALGSIDINIKVLEDLDYPLVPALKTIKNYLFDLNNKGKLL